MTDEEKERLIRNPAIEKWETAMCLIVLGEENPDLKYDLYREFWEKWGRHNCSFCNHYDCDGCPLDDGNCIKEWRDIYEKYFHAIGVSSNTGGFVDSFERNVLKIVRRIYEVEL